MAVITATTRVEKWAILGLPYVELAIRSPDERVDNLMADQDVLCSPAALPRPRSFASRASIEHAAPAGHPPKRPKEGTEVTMP
jgi:hypothetical protein